jgi:hypothetical protein
MIILVMSINFDRDRYFYLGFGENLNEKFDHVLHGAGKQEKR